MFKYGKKAGIMGVIAIALTVVPIVLVMLFLPQLGDSVPMRVDTAGNVMRWGNKYELLVAPVLCFAFTAVTFVMGFRQAKSFHGEPAMAVATFQRSMRNALVQCVVFIIATAVVLYVAVTGMGFGF